MEEGSQEPVTDMELQINGMAEVSSGEAKLDVQAIVRGEGSTMKQDPGSSPQQPDEKVTRTLNLARTQKPGNIILLLHASSRCDASLSSSGLIAVSLFDVTGGSAPDSKKRGNAGGVRLFHTRHRPHRQGHQSRITHRDQERAEWKPSKLG